MKRGFVIGILLLIGVLLLVTLGFIPKSIENYQDTMNVAVVNNKLTVAKQKAKFNQQCGKINGVEITCDTGFICSNGKCKRAQGAGCKSNDDCEFGTLCSTFTAGGAKMSLCLKPQ